MQDSWLHPSNYIEPKILASQSLDMLDSRPVIRCSRSQSLFKRRLLNSSHTIVGRENSKLIAPIRAINSQVTSLSTLLCMTSIHVALLTSKRYNIRTSQGTKVKAGQVFKFKMVTIISSPRLRIQNFRTLDSNGLPPTHGYWSRLFASDCTCDMKRSIFDRCISATKRAGWIDRERQLLTWLRCSYSL